MHSAPAVSYPVGRSHFHGWLVTLSGLGGTLTGLLWQAQTDLMAWRQGLFGAVLLGTGLLAVETWRRSPRGNLRWDGQVWSWTRGEASARAVLMVHLDLQFCMLLSLRLETGSRLWIWPERRTDAMRWDALRRAVFSRRGTGQVPIANAEAALAQVKS